MEQETSGKRLEDYYTEAGTIKTLIGKVFFYEEDTMLPRKQRMIYRVARFGINPEVLEIEDLERSPRYNEKGNNLGTTYIGRRKHSKDIEVDVRIVSTFMGSRYMDTRFLANYKGIIV